MYDDELWPLARLRLTAPEHHVELRVPDDADAHALARLSMLGVHDPEAMPFRIPWSALPPIERARSVLRHTWSQRVESEPAAWNIGFVAVVDGEVVGCQNMRANNYALLGEVSTSSWVGLAHHGRGIGTTMRTMVLSLAFDHWGAETARSGAFVDNPASREVSRKLGYVDDGGLVVERLGRRTEDRRFLLTRDNWRAAGRTPVVATAATAVAKQLGFAERAATTEIN